MGLNFYLSQRSSQASIALSWSGVGCQSPSERMDHIAGCNTVWSPLQAAILQCHAAMQCFIPTYSNLLIQILLHASMVSGFCWTQLAVSPRTLLLLPICKAPCSAPVEQSFTAVHTDWANNWTQEACGNRSKLMQCSSSPNGRRRAQGSFIVLLKSHFLFLSFPLSLSIPFFDDHTCMTSTEVSLCCQGAARNGTLRCRLQATSGLQVGHCTEFHYCDLLRKLLHIDLQSLHQPGAGWCIPDAWSFCVHAWVDLVHTGQVTVGSSLLKHSQCLWFWLCNALEAFVEALLQDVILHPADLSVKWSGTFFFFKSFSRYHATNLRTGLQVGKHGCPWNTIGSRHRILAHVIRDSANLLHVGLGCTLALRWWASLQPLLSSSLSSPVACRKPRSNSWSNSLWCRSCAGKLRSELMAPPFNADQIAEAF